MNSGRHTRIKLSLLSTLAACALACGAVLNRTAEVEPPVAHAPHVEDDPALVYSKDPADPWNRIFRSLFTRNVSARLSQEFPEGAPFVRGDEAARNIRKSSRVFVRFEDGDRAIEPLYPSFFDGAGPSEALREPRFSELKGALEEALGETRVRAPLARALMQADAWAAFDILFPSAASAPRRPPSADERQSRARREELLKLLARLVQKTALNAEEIASLPDNYASAVRSGELPDLHKTEGGWVEVEVIERRLHDTAADFRRAARVFVRPTSAQADPNAFLNGLLTANDRAGMLNGVALVIQNLLIDSDGGVVPSPLTYEVQFRFFSGAGASRQTEIKQLELSRRLLLGGAGGGGFVAHGDGARHYLPTAGNDYAFASRQLNSDGPTEPIVVTLRTRCNSCHGERAAHVFTFATHIPEKERVRLLTPAHNERALIVARLKSESEDFKALRRLWASR